MDGWVVTSKAKDRSYGVRGSPGVAAVVVVHGTLVVCWERKRGLSCERKRGLSCERKRVYRVGNDGKLE